MTDLSVPPLDREAIYASFIREAEQDTEQVLRVSNLTTEVQALRAKLLDAYDELVEFHRVTASRPHLKAKLAELGVPDPAALNIEPLRGKQKPAKRARPVARTAKAAGRPAPEDSAPSGTPAQPAVAAG
ncbi:hypothetical protein [Mycolicibacterium lutetiense]